MSDSLRKRGRPKGSGIDDTRTIQQVLELLDKKPDMKPTTAIRALGIENESVIRRLRDKLRAMTQQQLEPISATPESHALSHGAPQVAAEPTVTVNLDIQREPVKRSDTQPIRRRRTATNDAGPAKRECATSGDEPSISVPQDLAETTTPASEPAHSIPVRDPLTQLPMAIFAASVSAAQFMAIQNTLMFQAGLREAAKGYRPPTPRKSCPSCGHSIR